MPPLPTETTARFVVKQEWRGRAFSTLYRFGPGLGPVDALTLLATTYQTLATISYANWGVTGVDYYPVNDTVGQPAAVGGFPTDGTNGNDPLNFPDAYQVQVLGRTLQGRRVSWYHQGCIAVLDPNLRLSASDNSAVATLLGLYENLVQFDLCAIDGNTPQLKPYVNVVINDYLTRRSRRG